MPIASAASLSPARNTREMLSTSTATIAIGEERDEEREQHARLERRVLRGAVGAEVVALDELGKLLAGGLVHGGVGHLLSPISVSSRSISSSPCRGSVRAFLFRGPAEEHYGDDRPE